MRKINKITGKFLLDTKLNQYFTKKYFDYGIVAFAVLLGSYLKWDIENIILLAFIIWIILNPISSQLLAKVALAFLSFVPLLLIIRRDVQAEHFAIFAFFFMILTVAFVMVEFKSGRQAEPIGKKK